MPARETLVVHSSSMENLLVLYPGELDVPGLDIQEYMLTLPTSEVSLFKTLESTKLVT